LRIVRKWEITPSKWERSKRFGTAKIVGVTTNSTFKFQMTRRRMDIKILGTIRSTGAFLGQNQKMRQKEAIVSCHKYCLKNMLEVLL